MTWISAPKCTAPPGNDDFVASLAPRSSGKFAAFNGVTSGFEEAQGSLFSRGVALFGGHFRSIDWIAVDVSRERNLVILIGRLRGSPGGVGDWVVDDGSSFSVVAVNRDIAVNSQDGRQTLAQVLGGVGTGLAADVHGISVETNVAVAQVVNLAGGDDITSDFAVGVV